MYNVDSRSCTFMIVHEACPCAMVCEASHVFLPQELRQQVSRLLADKAALEERIRQLEREKGELEVGHLLLYNIRQRLYIITLDIYERPGTSNVV